MTNACKFDLNAMLAFYEEMIWYNKNIQYKGSVILKVDGYLSEKNLLKVLEYLYPEENWVHNKAIPKEIVKERLRENEHEPDIYEYLLKRKFRADYRSEELSIVVEFDGIQHYQSSEAMWNDANKIFYYESLGYTFIQIPYFVQPTIEIVKQYFNKDIEESLTEKMNGFNIDNEKLNRNLPSSFSEDGVRRFMVEFINFDEKVKDEILFTLYQNYSLAGNSMRVLPLSLIRFLMFDISDEDKLYNYNFALDKYPLYGWN